MKVIICGITLTDVGEWTLSYLVLRETFNKFNNDDIVFFLLVAKIPPSTSSVVTATRKKRIDTHLVVGERSPKRIKILQDIVIQPQPQVFNRKVT
jgi:hypothetical protein